MAAKIATITKMLEAMAARKFDIGSREHRAAGDRASGTLATIQALIAALAAVRVMNRVVTTTMTQGRTLCAHSSSSLRNRGPKPARRSAEMRPAFRAGTEIEAVMPHAPWC